MQTAPTSETINDTPPLPAPSGPVAIRIQATTAALRQRLVVALTRLRIALDLPSRTEVLALVTRLDELDARLTALAAADEGEERRRGRGRRG